MTWFELQSALIVPSSSKEPKGYSVEGLWDARWGAWVSLSEVESEMAWEPEGAELPETDLA